jgi:hypothetical protein
MANDKKQPSFSVRRRAVEQAARELQDALKVLEYEAERLAELEKRYPERRADKHDADR